MSDDLLRREQRARSILQWVALAAASAPTIERALQAAVGEVCRRMAWPIGHALARDGDGLRSTRIWHIADAERFAELKRISEEMHFPPGVGLPGRVLQSRKPLWIMDVTTDDNFPRSVSHLGVRAALGFPVLLGEEVLAVLEFFSPDAVEPDEPLLEVMATIGAQLARVMERVRAVEALQQSELRFRSVAETANDAIITSDAEGRIVTWNGAAEKMFGYREAEVRGRPLTLIIPERLRQRHAHGMERIRAGGERHVIGRTVELDGLRQNGSEFPLELSLATWEIDGERLFTGILRDITERREQAARLEKSERAAVEASRAKSLFLANMSHELRTPLNAILGFVQLMERDGALSGEQRDHLSVIMRSGEHLLGLINNVLSISKIEAGQSVLQPVAFSLERLLASLRELFHAPAEARGLRLSFAIESQLPKLVRGDEGKLRQVLINLVGNAVKFTARGSVEVRVRWAEGRAEFAVEDSGPGISAEDLTRVLQPFVQAGAGEGAGLGLAISRDFVRLLGGNLEVSSQLGRGSCFSFAVALPGAPGEAVTQTRVISLEAGQELRVLVVDNARDNRRLLARLLELVGFLVAEAENGEQALVEWERFRPHLIWMDMRMPVLDGYQATRQIRAREKDRHTVIIALTASAFDHDHSEIYAAGCEQVVLKPFREAEIFDVMERFIGARYVRSSAAASPAPVLSRARLLALPQPQLLALQQALKAGDDLAAEAAVSNLSDAELAAELLALVRNYQFDQLLALIERSS